MSTRECLNDCKSALKHIFAYPVTLVIYLSCAFISISFYFWFKQAPPDAPMLLLLPISWLSSFLSGVRFTFLQDIGFSGISPSGWHVIIEKSCSGGNFFIILFSLLAAVLPRSMPHTRAKLAVYAGSLMFSYLASIIASSMRIAASILMLDANFGFSQKLLHNIIGIITYFTFICVSYLAAQNILRYITRKERKG